MLPNLDLDLVHSQTLRRKRRKNPEACRASRVERQALPNRSVHVEVQVFSQLNVAFPVGMVPAVPFAVTLAESTVSDIAETSPGGRRAMEAS
jgi:hypothetical protein